MKKTVACISLGIAVVVVSGCALKGTKKTDTKDSVLTSTELLIEPLYRLNFEPSKEFPQNVQFVVKNSTSEFPNLKITAINTAGEDITALLGRPQMMPREQGPGRWDVPVAIPFPLTEKTLIGFKTIVELPGLKDAEGHELRKEQVFELKEGAYPKDHLAQGSPLAEFAVVNEFLLPPERASLDLTSFLQEALSAAGLGKDQESERARLRSRLEIVDDGSGKRVISLKGHVAFSYSEPGEALIRTNGYRLRLTGGDYSKVTVEVGVRPEVRASSTAQNPEIDPNVLKPPKLVNQLKNDDPEGLYPASRGPRGAAATEARCTGLVSKLTSNLEGFPGNRATCEQGLSALQGRPATLKLTFSFAEEDVPVTPATGQSLGGLVALQSPSGQSIFNDLSGTPCQFVDANPAQDTCVMAQYSRSAWQERTSLNADEELKNYLESHHASKILPESSSPNAGGYAGPGSLVATRADRNNPNEKLSGLIEAKPELAPLQDRLTGFAGHWSEGGTAYNAIANRCMEDLRAKASIQDAPIPGATPERASKVEPQPGELRSVAFQTSFPGLTLIDSVSFSARVKSQESAGSSPAARESLTCTLPAGRGGTLKIATGETGEFITLDGKKIFRFKEAVRNSMRPLAKELKILGEPGKDGFDAPVIRASFPAEIEEAEVFAQYEALAGAAGLPGLHFGFPNTTKHTLREGQATIVLADGETGSSAIANIDAHLFQQYCVKVSRDEKGQPISIEYFPVSATFPKGNEVRYEYSKGLLRAEAQAPFELYSAISGVLRLSSLPSLEASNLSTEHPGRGSVQGFTGGLRVGTQASQVTPLSGFWGFNRGFAPTPFLNGYHALGGAPTGGRPASPSGGQGGGGNNSGRGKTDSDGEFQPKLTVANVKAWAEGVLNKVLSTPSRPGPKSNVRLDEAERRDFEKAKEVIPLSPRHFSVTVDYNCKEHPAFRGGSISAGGFENIDMGPYQWTVRAGLQMWITDERYPSCGKVNGAFLNPHNCQARPRIENEGEPVFTDSDGQRYHRFPNTWEDYQQQLKASCERSEVVLQAVGEQWQEEADKAFTSQCKDNSGCKTAMESINFLSTKLAGKEHPSNLRGRLIADESYSPITIAELEKDLANYRFNRGEVERTYKSSERNGHNPDLGKIYSAISFFDTKKPTSLVELDNAVNEYESIVALMREVSRPGIKDNSLPQCSYRITGGRFRVYGPAKITSPLTSVASAQAKATNLYTSLLDSYSYPKNGAASTVDLIQQPDLSPLFGTGSEPLVLKDPDTAKPGKAANFNRAVIRDCADLANIARRDTMPLPRRLFTSTLCREAKAQVN